MAVEWVVLNVRYIGQQEDTDVETFRLPYSTSWIDLKAMLEAQYDLKDAGICYLDNDDDEVSINSEEELIEAFKVARQSGDVLHVQVKNLGPDCSLPFRPLQDRDPSPEDTSKEETGPTPQENMEELDVTPLKTKSADEGVMNTEETGEIPPSHVTRDAETGTIQAVVDQSAAQAETSICLGAEAPIKQKCNRDPEDGESYEEESSLPYSQFVQFLEKLKEELCSEIVRDVTRKTVRHVLKGLDGAVIESLHGPSGMPSSTKKKTGYQQSKFSHPVYAHDRIYCDNCNKGIIGPRYKCGNCTDFDLCEDCEALNGVHDEDHVFIKIRRPCPQIGWKDGVKKPLLKSMIYRSHHRSRETGKGEKKSQEGVAVDNKINFGLERMQEKFSRKQEKLWKKEQKLMEKQMRKEEKLKRRMEAQGEAPSKKEKLDLCDMVPQRDLHVSMSAQFICDMTIPDGTTVQPGTLLLKSWNMRNNGDGPWTKTTKLRHLWGNINLKHREVPVPHLKPGETGVVSVELFAPMEPGKYQSHWKLYDNGVQFGHRVWCSIHVQPKELLEPQGRDSLKVVEDTPVTGHPKEEPKTEGERDAREYEEIKTRPEEPEHLTEVAVKREVDTDADTGDIEVVKEEKTEEVQENPEMTTQLEQDLSTAVAQLQLDKQDDEEAEAPIEPVDLLTFEMLPRGPPLLSQTATPNNTPLDVSPPKSPAPEPVDLKALSASSSVELVDTGAGTDDQAEQLEQYVQERMASLGLKPDVDLESLSSLSDDDDTSSVSDDDYIVVPLPSCFDPYAPLTRSTMQESENLDDNHNNLPTEGTYTRVSVDEILTASNSLDTPPLSPHQVDPEPFIKITVEGTEAEKTEESQVSSISQENGATGGPSSVPTAPSAEQPGAVSSPDMMEDVGLTASQSGGAAAAAASAEDAQTQELPREDNWKELESEEPAQGEMTLDDETDMKKPIGTSAEVPRSPNINIPRPPPDVENQCGPSSPTDLANQIMNTAVTAATKAAGHAYTTAKAVFHTWQAKHSDWKPPKQNWKPKEQAWKPPGDQWKPPGEKEAAPKPDAEKWKAGIKNEEEPWKPNQWTPSADSWKPRTPATPMDKLIEMGFSNRKLNQELLDKHENDVETVIQELLETLDADWSQRRH